MQLVNFGFFVVALLTFRFLLHATLAWTHTQESDKGAEAPPQSTFTLLAHSTFLWIALEVVPVYEVSPDKLVLAFYCLATRLLLRLSESTKMWDFVIFGLVLGLEYWAKTILFPLGAVTIVVSYLWRRSHLSWRRGMLVTAFAFACICLPLILLLSHQKGRFTFGDTGKLITLRMYPPEPSGEPAKGMSQIAGSQCTVGGGCWNTHFFLNLTGQSSELIRHGPIHQAEGIQSSSGVRVKLARTMSNPQPTIQPTQSDVLYDFRELWQSPRWGVP